MTIVTWGLTPSTREIYDFINIGLLVYGYGGKQFKDLILIITIIFIRIAITYNKMHNSQNPISQSSTPTNRNIKKSDRVPSRAQINLKSRRKKNIPQIKIELDQMLHEAFNEMSCQPRKNIRIGNNDIYVLDN